MDAQMTAAILRQVISYIRSGNLCRARATGFSEQELRELRRLNATDLDALAASDLIVCRLSIDHDLLGATLRRLTVDVDRDRIIDRCLVLGASTQMMYAFYGLTGNDCATRRSLLGLESRHGRFAMPSEEHELEAYRRWLEICETPHDPGAAQDIQGMMALAEETDLPLGIVWQLVKSWAQARHGVSRDRQEAHPPLTLLIR
ncbi:DUF2857 domain-containing protein [Azotobacter vinelandii]|uniref:DUF2857 domain-containing protein n=1 Tax=Azotobacter vinelandii TaxID=354 RepID=UPI000AD682F8|nr:DUF2857 domain-containing protein [Azotobacter vinelandii]